MHILHSVPDSIPDFVESQYPLFAKLVESYYEYLLLNTDAKLLTDEHRYINSDFELEGYIDKLKNELGIDIPVNNEFNIELIIKFINFILSKRGTESGLKAFFKVAYKNDIIVSYPYNLLFIPSITRNMRTNYCLIITEKEVSTKVYSIKSYSSNIVGDIEEINTFVFDNKFYSLIEFYSDEYLLLDERVDLIGEIEYKGVNNGVHIPIVNTPGNSFKIGDIITFPNSVFQGEAEIVSLKKDFIGLEVISSGTNYSINDYITTNPNNGFFAKIESVDTNGGVTKISIKNKGKGFTSKPEIIIHTDKGDGLNLNVKLNECGGIGDIKIIQPCLLPFQSVPTIYTDKGNTSNVFLKRVPQVTTKKFLNDNHTNAINNIILDSNDVHNYSYNIITDLDIIHWKKYVDSYLHRSGYVYKHINPTIIKNTLTKKINSRIL